MSEAQYDAQYDARSRSRGAVHRGAAQRGAARHGHVERNHPEPAPYESAPDPERLRRRALFLRELSEAKALRDRVKPRRARAARMREQMRMRTFRW
ncbi:hypothetical protein V1J52_16605 [Streptomyces sp. TRM 70351]|uniref:hypothetical protein n=1 Tax=Streptomyces sp. TRM 70351 TaxID=3116552 RepID=UPI002E7B0B25|nr:hypothetical protein [Streptomyces sp. TRM 70351]MEE1929788.1 hypothetical protein [Streptomyces sp. TRM 70351]